MVNNSGKHLDFLNDLALTSGILNLGSLSHVPMGVHSEGRTESWTGKEEMQWRGFSASRHQSNDC